MDYEKNKLVSQLNQAKEDLRQANKWLEESSKTIDSLRASWRDAQDSHDKAVAEIEKQKQIVEAHKAANKRLVAEKNEEIRILTEVSNGQDEIIAKREKDNAELLQHSEKLQAEIASLQEANADLLAAAEVRSEELGKLKQIVRSMSRMGETSLRYTINELIAQWKAETTPELASGGFTGGYVEKIKKVVTRNNEVMATMFINGNECIAFPRTWQEYGKVLESGKELQIVYKEDNLRGYPQFIIESAGLLYEAESESEAAE